MNVMTVEGYHAKIEYDEELDLFRGEILGLNGGADFYGKNPKELRTEFKKSLQVFLDEDYGDNVAKWETAMKAFLKKAEDEEREPALDGQWRSAPEPGKPHHESKQVAENDGFDG